ncbi:MAG: ROK family protein [Spirochaetes bacterium]|nr:ROK family protein [Spirochaetota bacterium]
MKERSERVAAVDLGGTSAKIGIVDRSGTILARDRVSIDARAGFEDIVGPVAMALAELLAGSGGGPPAGIGIGAPGFIDPDTGTIVGGSENIPAMQGRSPAAYLAGKLTAPAWADNDATCAAAAELAYGAGRGLRGFLLVTVGTGIGGGLVLGGKVWRGMRGFAGEIGHVSLDPCGPPCPCGSRGCLEQYASGPAIVRAWKACAGTRAAEAESPLEVARLARAGDPAALEAFAGAGRALGQALGGTVNLLDIEACLIGGGVADAGEVLLEPVRRSLRRYAYPLVAEGVRVIAAELGNDAGLLGAAALAWERLGA